MLGFGSPKVQLLLELKNKMNTAMSKAKQKLGSDVNSMKGKLNELKASHSEAFQSMTDNVPMLGSALRTLGNPYTLIIAGLMTLLSLGTKATVMAANWERSMAKVNVTAQLNKQELRGVSSTIKDIAERNVTPLEQVPEAFNKIISAGLDVNSSMKLLEPTLQAAKAGFTDVETTAKAAVSVMASSGIKDAVRVYDILFATLNKGNAEFADIAAYLPKIVPMARNAGISLEDTAGAYAYLTAQGFRAEQAATGLQNVFKSLSDTRILYGSKTSKGLKGIGVDVFDATGKIKGLMSIIKDLRKSMSGLTDQQRIVKFDSIGLDMESAMTLSAMVQDYDKLSDIVSFTNNSQGQLEESIKNSETSLDNWHRITNLVKGTMTDMGDAILPHVAEVLADALNTMKDLKAETKDWMDTSESGSTIWWAIEKIMLNIKVLINAIKDALGSIKDAFGFAMDGYENTLRFFKYGPGFETVDQEKQRKQNEKAYDSNVWQPNKKFFTDINLINQVKKEYGLKFNATDPANFNPTDITKANAAFDRLKQLNYAKQSFNYALGGDDKVAGLLASKNTKVLKFLKEYGIKDKNDFYRLMQEGKLGGIMPLLPDLMQAATGAPGGKGKHGTSPAPGGRTNGGTDKVVGSSQQNRNITINFDSYIKGNVLSQNQVISKMSKEQLLNFLQENFKRLIANVETSYSG